MLNGSYNCRTLPCLKQQNSSGKLYATHTLKDDSNRPPLLPAELQKTESMGTWTHRSVQNRRKKQNSGKEMQRIGDSLERAAGSTSGRKTKKNQQMGTVLCSYRVLPEVPNGQHPHNCAQHKCSCFLVLCKNCLWSVLITGWLETWRFMQEEMTDSY